MATAFRSFTSNAYLLPNPEEYTPTVGEYYNSPAASTSMVSRSGKVLSAFANRAAMETVSHPVTYVGTYPVMAGDYDNVIWELPCASSNVPDQ